MCWFNLIPIFFFNFYNESKSYKRWEDEVRLGRGEAEGDYKNYSGVPCQKWTHKFLIEKKKN